jgi:GMP reductase
MKKFDYEDMNLIPRKCVVNSRSECDTSVKFGNFTFKIPIVPANMECIINEDLAQKLAENGYFYIMHRFGIDVFSFLEKMNEKKLFTSISVGVNEDSYKLIKDLYQNLNVIDYITIDIAHGHSIKMEKMIHYIKSKMPEAFLICGNVCTKEAVDDLTKWGADCVKVGVSPGKSCTTWPTTAFGSKNCQASTILECAEEAKIPIIADGGIRVPGDIARSIVLGASMCMVGGMLSGFKDSPGSLIDINGVKKKEFWGSASAYSNNKKNRIEGTKILVDYKERSVLDEMICLQECLQSSISYGGGNDLKSLLKVKYK